MDKEIQYFFVDESGDATFYDKRRKLILGNDGVSKILMLGLIRTNTPEVLRNAIAQIHAEIKKDNYLKKIPSIQKTNISFHAKDDCPEVREKVFKKIVDLDFKAEFVVARKLENIFISRHKSNLQNFYDDLITKLFENKLHKKDNIIYFSQRGNKIRQHRFENAVLKAKLNFESKWKKTISTDYQILVQTPIGEPCLQIIDYMNWAVQRAFTKDEDRYYKFVEEKISFLLDIYDFAKYPNNYYNSKRPFDINKKSPL